VHPKCRERAVANGQTEALLAKPDGVLLLLAHAGWWAEQVGRIKAETLKHLLLDLVALHRQSQTRG
jgi:hypothetical protein